MFSISTYSAENWHKGYFDLITPRMCTQMSGTFMPVLVAGIDGNHQRVCVWMLTKTDGIDYSQQNTTIMTGGACLGVPRRPLVTLIEGDWQGMCSRAWTCPGASRLKKIQRVPRRSFLITMGLRIKKSSGQMYQTSGRHTRLTVWKYTSLPITSPNTVLIMQINDTGAKMVPN